MSEHGHDPGHDEQDTEGLESLLEARAILVDALDAIAEAAYVIGEPRGLLPHDEDGDVAFDHEDLRKTGHATLHALAAVADAIYATLDTLPLDPDEDEDEDEDGDDDELDGEDADEGAEDDD
ncbi:MAG: hypothetical protein KC635_28965 [Myxococcales bacterium]|nr:hypothetical protein [Myxococcales bacterium]MCB9734173.1 hypothetical protein [Deltaproteobacteria bacterium]